MRLSRFGSLMILGLMALTFTPTAGAALPGPTIRVNPFSGPVGSTVVVSGTQGCGGVSFMPSPSSGPQGFLGVDYVGSARGVFQIKYVIPPYFQGGLRPHVVGPRRYQFDISCNDSNNPATVVRARVPFTVTSNAVPPGRFVGMASTPDGGGYWLAQAGGGVFSYGNARFEGSLSSVGIMPAAPVVGIAAASGGSGYWLADALGGVYSFGSAKFHGSLPERHGRPDSPIVGMTTTPSGAGYWLVGIDGGVFAFGDAGFFGSESANGICRGLAPTQDGRGYQLLGGGGRLTVAFGNAEEVAVWGPLEHRLAGFAATQAATGFWFVDIDGDVATGGAGDVANVVPSSYGSLRSLQITPSAPIVGIVRTPDAGGYWVVAEDGGVFAFGNADFHGSAAAG